MSDWFLLLWALVGIVGGAAARVLAGANAPHPHPEGTRPFPGPEGTLEGRMGFPPLAGEGLGERSVSAPTRMPLWPLSCPTCGRTFLRRDTLFGGLLPGSPSAVGAEHSCPACEIAVRAFPFAELAGGLIFLALATRLGGLPLIVASVASVVLLALSLADISYRLIPNRILYPTALALAAVEIARLGPFSPLVGAAVCGGFFGAAFLLGVLLRGPLAGGRLPFGMGDVKLAFFVGLVVGWPAAPSAITLTVLSGVVLAVLWVVSGQRNSSLPYGTALAIGAVGALLVHT